MTSILVVDDSDADQFIIETLINKIDSSIQLYKSWDGEEALEYLNDYSNETPNIIFLDINMPRMNGFEFLEAYLKLLNKGGLLKSLLSCTVHQMMKKTDKKQKSIML